MKAEQDQLIREWNDSECSYISDCCMPELFEIQVERVPDAVSTALEDERVTYLELNRRANTLAKDLVARGVGPQSVVALLMVRGIDLLTSILAVFKSDGAYVPLEPNYPASRLSLVLGQSGSLILITQRELLPVSSSVLSELSRRTGLAAPAVLVVDELLQTEDVWPNSPPRCGLNDLAYVIHTSGSTGMPKGAMVEHRGMLNHLFAKIDELQLCENDSVAQTASQSFDISVWQFLSALLVGGTVHIFADGITHDPRRLFDELKREAVSIFETVPSLLRAALDEGAYSGVGDAGASALRWIIVTGEALPPDLCRQWLGLCPSVPILNAYGPTECSDDVSHYRVVDPPRDAVARMPIGRPVSNMQLYALDPGSRLSPIGISAELYVGGVGVGRGYLDDPTRTADAFVPDPFTAEPGSRLYKTGDLVRYLSDGNIEFLGRIDQQVKVRGHRIELGEIESALGGHLSVKEAIVLAREDAPGQTRLIAYVVAHQRQALSATDLRGYLNEILPDYMTPSVFVMVDAFPLTANGKVDRSALPAPHGVRPHLEKRFAAPRIPVEITLAEIWKKVLRVGEVGIHDNFFELGGDSILMIQIISRAGQAGIGYSLRQAFQHQTIAELAQVVSSGKRILAEQGVVSGSVPLTPAQHWFIEQDLADMHYFNQAVLFVLREPMVPSLLEQTLSRLLIQHDALRLRLSRDDSGLKQFLAGPDGDGPLSVLDLSAIPECRNADVIESIAAQLQAGLNLFEGPLIRVALFDVGPHKPQRLLIVIHHMAIDGVSWRVLLEDIQTVYQQLSRRQAVDLPPKTTSFKEWAEKLVEHSRSAELREEASYWLASGRQQVPRVPVDYARGANQIGSIRNLSVSLDPEQTELLLQSVPVVFRSQVNDVLLMALAQTFAREAGWRRLFIDLEGHGREEIFDDVDLTRTVGWFTSIFPVLLDLGEAESPIERLKLISEQMLNIPNRGVGFGMLYYLGNDQALSARLRELPKAEIIFNYLGQFRNSTAESSYLEVASESSGPARSPRQKRRYLLEINCSVMGDRLRVEWLYSEDVHKRATIERLAQGFIDALESLIASLDSPLLERHTPLDFPGAELSNEMVDKALAEIELD
jgi:amino acid adenylation domain-containing protein/non-ribosomal peptide synthase protein (TIGR01720 family)